jgi:rfaE bifunctional protein nucleotidyltransferase chain/domain
VILRVKSLRYHPPEFSGCFPFCARERSRLSRDSMNMACILPLVSFACAAISMGKIISQDELIQVTAREKRSGRRVVFTNGCFDLLHPGHVRCLAEARALGDVLVVAVNSDHSVRGNKGPERPLVPEQDRAEVLAALASVDYVTIFDELTPRELISRVLPSILVKGADWAPDQVAGREEVEAAGGRVVSIPLAPGYSTTNILQRIRNAAAGASVASRDTHNKS